MGGVEGKRNEREVRVKEGRAPPGKRGRKCRESVVLGGGEGEGGSERRGRTPAGFLPCGTNRSWKQRKRFTQPAIHQIIGQIIQPSPVPRLPMSTAWRMIANSFLLSPTPTPPPTNWREGEQDHGVHTVHMYGVHTHLLTLYISQWIS